MKLKYVTGGFGVNPIKKVECVRETEKSVWIVESWNGKEKIQQTLKRSSWRNYFDTFEEAKQFLIKDCEHKLMGLQGRVSNEQKNLVKLYELKDD